MNKTLGIGNYIGKYRIVERIGRGGMAEVYKGHQENLNRYVAIKVMHSYLAEEEAFLVRFQREARAMAAAEHPNICHVYDFDVDQSYYYIVMEYLSGSSLKDRIDKLNKAGDHIDLNEAVQIIAELTDALGYAHQCGMIHRDIKPANIMFNDRGAAVLTDFGIAKMVSAGSSYMTSTGAMIGTPAYMSPEQGLGEVGDMRSDIYSLGALAYHLLSGRLPHDGDTPLSVVLKHVNDTPKPISDYNANIPPDVEKIIAKAMAKAPEDRYQTAADMGHDLKNVLTKNKFNVSTAPTLGEIIPHPNAVEGESFPEDWDQSWAALESEAAAAIRKQDPEEQAFELFKNGDTPPPHELDVFGELDDAAESAASIPVFSRSNSQDQTDTEPAQGVVPDWMAEMEEPAETEAAESTQEPAQPSSNQPVVPTFMRELETEDTPSKPVAEEADDLMAALMSASAVVGEDLDQPTPENEAEAYEYEMQKAISDLSSNKKPVLTTGHVRRINRRDETERKERASMQRRLIRPIAIISIVVLGLVLGYFGWDQFFNLDNSVDNPVTLFNAWLNTATGGETAENIDLSEFVATPEAAAADDILSNLLGSVEGTALVVAFEDVPADVSNLIAVVQVESDSGDWNTTQWSYPFTDLDANGVVQALDDAVLDGRTYRWAVFELPNSVEPISTSTPFGFPESGEQVSLTLSLDS